MNLSHERKNKTMNNIIERLEVIRKEINIVRIKELKDRYGDKINPVFFKEDGTLNNSESVKIRERKKYFAIDIGNSGAFLVEKITGEIYNIKAYGVADKNKKKKANLGTIWYIDPKELYNKRYNYLR
jgi:hypothetical protein